MSPSDPDDDRPQAGKKPSRARAAILERIWSAAPRGRPVPRRLRELLGEAKLGALEQSIATLSRRAITLRAGEGRSVAVGKARLGGTPDLPLKIPWPERDGRLLSFILQVPVDDALLSLFTGASADTSEVEHLVLAVPLRGLQRKPLPSTVAWRDEAVGLLEPLALEPEEGWQVPPSGSDPHRALLDRHPELAALEEAYQAVEARLAPPAASYLFGFPANAALERKHRKLEPLMTVRSEARAQRSFWGAGTLDVLAPVGRRVSRGVVAGTVAEILTS